MNEERNTPYFLIHKQALDQGLGELKAALETFWPNYVIGHSYKTNALPWVIEYFRDQGSYAEVVSDDEYDLARSVRVPVERIIYNGIAKSRDTFLEAVRCHAIVNVDAAYEIDWLDDLAPGEYTVGVRVNFDMEKTCPGQTPYGAEGSRFGFCYENGELKKAIDRIESKGVKVRGLHLHRSSHTRMPNIYEAIARAAVDIGAACALKLDYVDIGGGFFGGLSTKPPFTEYIEKVRNILIQRFDPKETALVVEPGMALIGASVSYVTTVLDVKRTPWNVFLMTDGSRTQIDPLMRKSSYFHEILKKPGKERVLVPNQVVTGYTCMETDRLFNIREAPEVLPGDQIVYHKVGAYTMCLSPLFIKWFPAVYVEDGVRVYRVRDRWSVQEYSSRSVRE